jgi:2'-5' RNA ligase
MVQTVELLPDDVTEQAVLREWAALADAGLPGQAGHHAPSNRPHVTLTVSTEPWPAPVEAAIVAAVGDAGLPVPLTLGGLVVFPHGPRCVLARLVVPSAALLALHARLAAVTRDAPGAVPHVAPGRWTPHVTLARRFPVARLGEAVTVLAGVPELAGVGVRLRRWDGEARREWPLAAGVGR